MLNIKYRLPDTEEWSTLSLHSKYFEYCSDDESVAIELEECLKAAIETPEMDEDALEDAYRSLIFEAGDHWNDVVIPLYERSFDECQLEDDEMPRWA